MKTRRTASNRAATICIVLLLSCPASLARTIYVDDDAAGDNDGTAWPNAYRDLQSALDVAQVGDEIRVAGGSYRPSKGMLVSESARYASFSLISGVAIRGGFAGAGGADPDARDVARFESILSGDVEGDESGVKKGSYNCFHVVTGDNVDATAVLDGFTIEGGVADRLPPVDDAGGGLTIDQGSPTIIGCTFRRNSARNRGGAVAACQSQGAFIDCTFVENTSSYTGGAVEINASELQFTGCAFLRNAVNTRYPGGGAVYTIGRSHCEFTYCRFVANRATRGGAVRNEDSISVFENCLFAGNRAYYYFYSLAAASWEPTGPPESDWPDLPARGGGFGVAGAVYNGSGGTLTLNSCTVADNHSDLGGGIYNWAGSPCTLVNCIFWGNSDQAATVGLAQIGGSDVVASYCCIQGPGNSSLAGMSNLAGDPLFARPGHWVNATDPATDVGPQFLNGRWIDGDYHLQSQAGRWDPNASGWVPDEVTSPCIDAGDPSSPVADEPQPNGGRINMGAYGGTAEASRSYSGEPVLVGGIGCFTAD